MVYMGPNQSDRTWQDVSHGGADFSSIGKRKSGKRRPSMANNPEFADAYSMGNKGRRYIDIKKAFALGRKFYDSGDKKSGDLLFARAHGAYNKMKNYKISQGKWNGD